MKTLKHASLISFGRYRGQKLEDIPIEYFNWLWQRGIKELHPPVGKYIKENLREFKRKKPNLTWKKLK